MTQVEVDGKFYMLLGPGKATSGDNIVAEPVSDKVPRWIWIGENENLFHQDYQRFLTNIMHLLSMLVCWCANRLDLMRGITTDTSEDIRIYGR